MSIPQVFLIALVWTAAILAICALILCVWMLWCIARKRGRDG